MKDILKAAGLLAVGLLTVAIIYPVLHEAGHAAAALLTGAAVTEIRMFPVPSVLCRMQAGHSFSLAVVACSGPLLPFFAALFLSSKWFWVWYVRFLLLGCSVLSFVLALLAAVTYAWGYPVMQEDLTKVFLYAPEYTLLCCAVHAFMLVLGVDKLRRAAPFQRCLELFGV